MENQHKKIIGYRDLTQPEIDTMNAIKDAEREIAELLAKVKVAVILSDIESKAEQGEALRQAAIARTDFESAFMRLVRAVARPASPWMG